jgi:hypothetical protein
MIVACSPACNTAPSPSPLTNPLLTTILSIDSSAWYVPLFPSWQPSIVFGAFGSFPFVMVPRPLSKSLLEHSEPCTKHLGAPIPVSKTAVCGCPAVRIVTGIVENEESDPSLAVTVMDPMPSADEVG